MKVWTFNGYYFYMQSYFSCCYGTKKTYKNKFHFFRNLDLEELIAADANVPNTCYDLIANIVHEGDPNEGKGSYRVHIFHQVIEIIELLCGLSDSFSLFNPFCLCFIS